MKNCIFCKGEQFKDEIDLGLMYPSAFVPKDFDYSNAKKYETKIVSCKNCGFVQMSEMPNQDSMYREYWYRSSLNSSMVDALKDVVVSTEKRHGGDTIRFMDIASNDATLLSMYPKHTFRVGVDPANNLAKYYTKDNCDVFINDYFTSNIHFLHKFDIITSIAVFYDLPDPLDFIKGIAQNLDSTGIWVMQMTDLMSTIKDKCIDNIVHEHLAYWTLEQFCKIVGEANLEVFDVEYNDVNGGSLRAYVCRKGSRIIQPSVIEALEKERIVLKNNPLSKFNEEIIENKNTTMVLLETLNSLGYKVAGMGASTKGNTILQYYGITNRHLYCIGEVSKEKFGLYTIGSHIPIVSEQEMFEGKPQYIYLLCWHFASTIIAKHQKYLDDGGKFIVSMPKPAVIDKFGLTHLE